MCKDVSSSSPLLSIVIPVFNNENTITDCLNSIIYSFKDCIDSIEIILINDGSTDNINKKIKKFLSCKYVSIINQKNSGVSVARNTGIDNVNGKYVWFIDADDSVNKFNGEKLLSNLIYQNADLYLFGFKKYFYLNNGNYNCKIVWNHSEQYYTREVFLKKFTEIFTKNEFNVPWNKIYKLSIIKKYHIKYIPKMKSGEDAAFNCDYIIHCKSLYIIPKVLYNYNILKMDTAYYSNYYNDLKVMLNKIKNMTKSLEISNVFLNNKYLEIKKGFIDNLYLKFKKNKVSWKVFYSELQNYSLGNKIEFFKLTKKNKIKYVLCVNIVSVYFTYFIKSRLKYND